jgi:transcriptional regulator with PAS, ATPase and Fis domain
LAVLGRTFDVRFSDTLGDLKRDAMTSGFCAIVMGMPREDDALAVHTAAFISQTTQNGLYFIVDKRDPEDAPCLSFPDRKIPVLEIDQLHTLQEKISIRSAANIGLKKAIFTGKSKGISKVAREIIKYAALNNPVLVLGETGTGKELAARALHELSRRSHRDFVALNCSAIPESLVESELFGTEKGAFTDAIRHSGAFGRASGGTLFLDEIGSMTPYAQPRLLRVLESGEYVRLGADRTEKSDFRLVSATCDDLSELVARSRFRADLFYRVSDLVIRIPPLRERLEDLEELASLFCAEAGAEVCELSREAVDKLMGHDWPGNIRELKSVINRACVTVGEGLVGSEHIDFMAIPKA